MAGQNSGRWDAQRSSKAQHQWSPPERRCINCGRDAAPRYLYCSDRCSRQSRAKLRAKKAKTDA